MKILGYIGDHQKDGITARLGWALVRLAQVGATYRRVTHTEALLSGSAASATIASSSLRDGGVRVKTTALNPAHWVVIDVPTWDEVAAASWFEVHAGEPYDRMGAMASVLWFLPHALEAWFCNEAVGAAVGLIDPHGMPPSMFMAIARLQPGARDVTAEFFK